MSAGDEIVGDEPVAERGVIVRYASARSRSLIGLPSHR
jgi:hypothetical protein